MVTEKSKQHYPGKSNKNITKAYELSYRPTTKELIPLGKPKSHKGSIFIYVYGKMFINRPVEAGYFLLTVLSISHSLGQFKTLSSLNGRATLKLELKQKLKFVADLV